MEKIKAIIVDDEHHARTVLTKLLAMSFPEIEIIGEGGSLPEAVDLIHANSPDLVFLDIEMPNYSGLQINDFVKSNRNFEIVFVTAYNHYAINAIKISAFDYLLKPVQLDDLKETISRFKEKQTDITVVNNKLEILNENLKPNQPKKLVIQTHQGIHYFYMDGIHFLEASGMYTFIHSKTGKFMASKPIKDFEDLLDNNFYRIHRSYIVNCNSVIKFSAKEGNSVSLVDGSSLPLSRAKKVEFFSKLNILK